jgi:hypothetical protein
VPVLSLFSFPISWSSLSFRVKFWSCLYYCIETTGLLYSLLQCFEIVFVILHVSMYECWESCHQHTCLEGGL